MKMLLKLTGLQVAQGIQHPTYYRLAWREMNCDAVVYAPAGLHWLARFCRAARCGAETFWFVWAGRF